MKKILIINLSIFCFFSFYVSASELDDFQKYVENENQSFRSYMEEQEKEFEKYKAEIIAKWNEFKDSTKKEWVNYGKDKETKSEVDFEKGTVTVEVLVDADEKQPKEIAEKKILKQLKRTISDKWPTKRNPLEGQIKLNKKESLSEKNAAEFVKREITPKIKVEEKIIKSKDNIKRKKVSVTFDMVPDHIKVRADRYKDTVLKYSQQRDIDPSIMFGIIHTESFFNPMAKSYIPAFGLMQLVPKSGGRDAYRHVFKKDIVPTSTFLYDPENNINLGIGYFDLTKNRYFSGVKSETALYLISVASYNTGPGNVAKAFCGRTKLRPAIEVINSMNAKQIHETLLKKLPYKETQDYVQRVFGRSKMYR